MISTVMEKMVRYFQNDVRRINHAVKVHGFASILYQDIGSDEMLHQIIGYAAVLHDIGIKEAERRYNSSAGKYQEEEGPPIARQILSELHVDEEIIDRVCFIIGNHHSYSKIDGIDFQIIVEADFLVNIFEDDMSQEAIENICHKIFRTKTGMRLLKSMYMS